MEIRYNVTGAQRKELVKVIGDTTGAKAKYMGMPTASYEIDYFTVTKLSLIHICSPFGYGTWQDEHHADGLK